MGLVDDQKLIEALLSHNAHPTFRVGIGVGCSNGGVNDADGLRLESSVVRGGELLVIVVHQETMTGFVLPKLSHVLPRSCSTLHAQVPEKWPYGLCVRRTGSKGSAAKGLSVCSIPSRPVPLYRDSLHNTCRGGTPQTNTTGTFTSEH